MEEFYSLSIKLHVISILLTMLMSFVQLLLTNIKNPIKAIHYLWKLLPLYYCLLACVIFTGAILLKFTDNLVSVFSMSIVWIFVLVTTIKTYKWMKFAQKDTSLGSIILKQIRKKYLIDLALFCGLIFLV